MYGLKLVMTNISWISWAVSIPWTKTSRMMPKAVGPSPNDKLLRPNSSKNVQVRQHRVRSTPSPTTPPLRLRPLLPPPSPHAARSLRTSRPRPRIPPTAELETLGGDGPRRAGQGVRRSLLRDLRHQPRRAGHALPGRVHAHLRGRQVHGRRQHRQQAHLAPLRAVPAHHRHRRLPALRSPGRHDRLRLRQHRYLRRGTAAPPQVLPGPATLPSDPTLPRLSLSLARNS
jgi:hypothetical protein